MTIKNLKKPIKKNKYFTKYVSKTNLSETHYLYFHQQLTMTTLTKKEMRAVIENALKSNSQAEALKAVAMYQEWEYESWNKKLRAKHEELTRWKPKETVEERRACVEKHLVFLKSIAVKKGKGKDLRRDFVSFIYCGVREFESEEKEYEYVVERYKNKYELAKVVDENEWRKIVDIMRDYGCLHF